MAARARLWPSAVAGPDVAESRWSARSRPGRRGGRGEGFHARAGRGRTPRSRRSGRPAARAAGATLYVTLEPCAHQAARRRARTRSWRAGVARVVAALGDPNPRCAGGGAAALRARRRRGDGRAVCEAEAER